MTHSPLRPILCLLALSIGIPFVVRSAPPPPDALLLTMQRELARAMSSLAKSDPAPYFLSYAAEDRDGISIVAANGSLLVSQSAAVAKPMS